MSTTLPATAAEARAAISAATEAGDTDTVELLRCVLLLDEKGMLDWSPIPQEEDLTQAAAAATSAAPARTEVLAAPDMVSLLDTDPEPATTEPGTREAGTGAAEDSVPPQPESPQPESPQPEPAQPEPSPPGGPVALPVVCVVGDAAEVPDAARQWTRDQLGRVLARLSEVHQTTSVSASGEVGEWAQHATHTCPLSHVGAPTTSRYDVAVVVWDGRLAGRAYRTVVATMAAGHPVIRIDPAARAVSSRGQWESS